MKGDPLDVAAAAQELQATLATAVEACVALEPPEARALLRCAAGLRVGGVGWPLVARPLSTPAGRLAANPRSLRLRVTCGDASPPIGTTCGQQLQRMVQFPVDSVGICRTLRFSFALSIGSWQPTWSRAFF